MVSAEVHAHIAPSPKASVLHGSEKNCRKVSSTSKNVQYRLSNFGGFKINYKKRKKKIGKIASYVAYSLLFLVPRVRILWTYDPFFNSLLLAPTPNFLLLITYIRLPRLPSSCDWLILANSIGLPRTTFKQKVYVCISVYLFSTCHWIFLNTIGINSPLWRCSRRCRPAIRLIALSAFQTH